MKEQLIRIIATSTVELLLDELKKGVEPTHHFLETFTPADIAHNAAAAIYCLEKGIIPEGHTKEELEQLKEMSMSVYEANQTKGSL